MKKLLTLFTLLLCVCSGAWGDNGDVLFSQNFNSATTVNYTAATAINYTATGTTLANLVGDGDNLFSGIACTSKNNCGIFVNGTGGDGNSYSGKFGAYCNNTSWAWGIYKAVNMSSTSPTAIKVQFKLQTKFISSGNGKVYINFAVGGNFSNGTSAPSASKIYTGFAITSGSNDGDKHYISKFGSTTKLNNTAVVDDDTELTYTWFINNTGEDLVYEDPNGQTQTLATGTWDLWIGTTLVIDGTSRTASGSSTFSGTSLQQLYIGNSVSGRHHVILDDVVVTDLSPETFEVTYKANNGTAETDVVETVATVGDCPNKFSAPSGKSFAGWNTQADGEGTDYAVGDAVTSTLTLFAQWIDTPVTITYNLNVGSSASTTILASSSTTDETNINNITVDQTKAAGDGNGTTGPNRTTKLPIKTGDNGDTYDSPTNYVLFKYTIESGKQFTPTDVTIKVANVGGSSKDNIKYKAVLSDGVNSISATYIVGTQDGTVETFHITNNSNVVFKGDVVLKLWAWTIANKTNGGSAFRMGTPLTISGYVSDIPESVPVTIGASGYASYCSSYALDFSTTDVKAYTAKVDENEVKLTKVDNVPASEGVILYCETPGTYNIPVMTSADAVGDNEMVGVLVRTLVEWTTGGKYNYILQQGKFNMADDGYLKPNRAYLSTTYNVNAPGAKPLTIVFNDEEQGEETDGIKSVQGSGVTVNGEGYNLSGQRVGADYKGLVIINGKKVIRK